MYPQPLPSNVSRARTASALLLVGMILFGVQSIKSLIKMVMGNDSTELATFFLVSEGILGIIQFFLLIISAIFFIMWFRRAYNNLHLCGVRDLPYKEGWAAGGWFVPIISLFYPYKIMNSIWTGTQTAVRKTGEHYDMETEANIGWWWAFWIIGNMVSNIHGQLTLRASFSPFEPGMSAMELISDSSLCISAYICWNLIKKTSAHEEALQLRYTEWLSWQTQLQAERFQQQNTPPDAV